MARINLDTFKQTDKNRNTLHTKVLATYTVFELEGEKYLQIDTFGKSDREMPEKISQSFQIDRDTAKYIMKLLVDEFDLTITIH